MSRLTFLGGGEVAIVVDKDGGTFVALLGEFAFQLCKKSHFS